MSYLQNCANWAFVDPLPTYSFQKLCLNKSRHKWSCPISIGHEIQLTIPWTQSDWGWLTRPWPQIEARGFQCPKHRRPLWGSERRRPSRRSRSPQTRSWTGGRKLAAIYQVWSIFYSFLNAGYKELFVIDTRLVSFFAYLLFWLSLVGTGNK